MKSRTAVAGEIADRADFPAVVARREFGRRAVDADLIIQLAAVECHHDLILAVAREVAAADERPCVAAEVLVQLDPVLGTVGPDAEGIELGRTKRY